LSVVVTVGLRKNHLVAAAVVLAVAALAAIAVLTVVDSVAVQAAALVDPARAMQAKPRLTSLTAPALVLNAVAMTVAVLTAVAVIAAALTARPLNATHLKNHLVTAQHPSLLVHPAALVVFHMQRPNRVAHVKVAFLVVETAVALVPPRVVLGPPQ
jgi:hypothetical protein